jgi:nitroreductase
MTNFIDSLQWRFASKSFDSKKQVPQEDVEFLKKAIQLSVSSYGLQQYQVVIIQDKKLQEKLTPASYNQTQIAEASHVFVFCSMNNVDETTVDEFMENTAKTRGIEKNSLNGFAKMIQSKIDRSTKEQLAEWTDRQSYITMTNLLNACAVKEIDSCPMEGFIPEKYIEILDLEKYNLKPVLVVPIGYRTVNDKYAKLAKVRKPLTDLFIEL